MLTQSHANTLAQAWLNAWNRHDLPDILSHYAEDISFTSPFIVALQNSSDGTVHGKIALAGYFAQGLAKYPELAFQLLHVVTGVNSLTLIYKSVNNLLAAEVMELNREGLIQRVQAHYCQP
jgi:hypothetical protein